jgi:hypothetical protein
VFAAELPVSDTIDEPVLTVPELVVVLPAVVRVCAVEEPEALPATAYCIIASEEDTAIAWLLNADALVPGLDIPT